MIEIIGIMIEGIIGMGLFYVGFRSYKSQQKNEFIFNKQLEENEKRNKITRDRHTLEKQKYTLEKQKFAKTNKAKHIYDWYSSDYFEQQRGILVYQRLKDVMVQLPELKNNLAYLNKVDPTKIKEIASLEGNIFRLEDELKLLKRWACIPNDNKDIEEFGKEVNKQLEDMFEYELRARTRNINNDEHQMKTDS